MGKETSEAPRILRNADWGERGAPPAARFSSFFVVDLDLFAYRSADAVEAQRIDEWPFWSFEEEHIVPCFDA